MMKRWPKREQGKAQIWLKLSNRVFGEEEIFFGSVLSIFVWLLFRYFARYTTKNISKWCVSMRLFLARDTSTSDGAAHEWLFDVTVWVTANLYHTHQPSVAVYKNITNELQSFYKLYAYSCWFFLNNKNKRLAKRMIDCVFCKTTVR